MLLRSAIMRLSPHHCQEATQALYLWGGEPRNMENCVGLCVSCVNDTLLKTRLSVKTTQKYLSRRSGGWGVELDLGLLNPYQTRGNNHS